TAAVVARAKATRSHEAGCQDSRAIMSKATSRFSVYDRSTIPCTRGNGGRSRSALSAAILVAWSQPTRLATQATSPAKQRADGLLSGFIARSTVREPPSFPPDGVACAHAR